MFTGGTHRVSYYRGAPRRRAGRSNQLFNSHYKEYISNAATRNQLDPSLIQAVIHVESAFNPKAISPKGACGLMQLMPGTARGLGVRNPFDPGQNIAGGAKHLSKLLRKYGNTSLALAAYNAGQLAVEKYRGIPPYNETVNYVRQVLYLKGRYKTLTAS